MITPDMATMLAFVFTDADRAGVAQTLLRDAIASKLNGVTVDGDTSTCDTLMIFATEAAARAVRQILRAGRPRLQPFRTALDEVLLELALHVLRDGEGAGKFIEMADEARLRQPRPTAWRCASPIRRWSRPRSPRGCQLGPYRHGGRQSRRRRGPRNLTIGFGGARWRSEVGATRTTAKRRRRVHEDGRDPIAIALGLGGGRDRV